MKKIKNKFILLIIFIIGIIIIFQLFISSFLNKVDRSSYVLLMEGKGSLNSTFLQLDKRIIIDKKSSIKSIGKNSVVIIEWGDGSITRLGGDTDIVINEFQINDSLSKIQIDFDLLSGKSWSNVISFLGKDSYFKESFNELEAGVRGTIFNVDLDKGYINVLNHEVKLTNSSGEVVLIEQNKPFSIKTLSFIDIKDFLINIKDSTWEKYNFDVDDKYLENLKNDFSNSVDKSNPFLFFLRFFSTKYSILYNIYNLNSFDTISKQITELDSRDKIYLYNKVLSKYQNVHFSNGTNREIFLIKIYYKKLLILLADNKNKTYLVKNALFDLTDILKLKDKELLKDILSIFEDNKDFIKDINLDFSSYFNKLNININELFGDNIKNFNNIFNIDLKSIGGINNEVLNKAHNVKKTIEGEINKQLNNLIGK